jgi:hypothetical protein
MARRERSWPVRFLIGKPTKENPHGTSQMFYAHEWDAYQKSLPPELRDPDFTDSTKPAGDDAAPVETSAESADTAAATTSEFPASSLSSTSSASLASSSSSHPPDLDRHSRRCVVCAHPDRDAIEGDFIRWRSPKNIAEAYHIADRSSFYRHAHATGLFARRRREFARVLEDILENVEDSSLENTADVIIRAARVYAHIDENGNWVEPTRTNIILTGPAPPQFTGTQDIEISAGPPRRPRDIPFKLANKFTNQKKAKKRLMETDHPSRMGIMSDQREPKDLSSDQIRKPKITPGTRAKKKLMETHPSSKNGPTQ